MYLLYNRTIRQFVIESVCFILLVLRPCELWSCDLRRVAVEPGGHIYYVSIVIGTYCKALTLSYGQFLGETLSVYLQNSRNY